MWLAALAAGLVLASAWWLRGRWVIVKVRGPSMEPTYYTGDRVLVQRVAAEAVRRDQVVVVRQPDPELGWADPAAKATLRGRKWMIKRVAAVPGDPVPEQLRLALGPRWQDEVPADFLVLLGDNADRSTDSRDFGFVPADRVMGMVLRRFAG